MSNERKIDHKKIKQKFNKVKKIQKVLGPQKKYHCEANKTIELTYSFSNQGKNRCGVGMPQIEHYKDYSNAIEHLMNLPRLDDVKFIEISQKLWFRKYRNEGGSVQWGGWIPLFRFNIDDESENVNIEYLKEILPGHSKRCE